MREIANKHLIPLVFLGILVLSVGFFQRISFSPTSGYFDCRPSSTMDFDVEITGNGNPNLPGLDVRSIDFDMNADTEKIRGDKPKIFPYGQANGDQELADGGYTVFNKGNSLYVNGGKPPAHNSFLHTTISISGTPPVASISGTIGNSLIGGVASGLSSIPVEGNGNSVKPYSITFLHNGDKITISWSCV